MLKFSFSFDLFNNYYFFYERLLVILFSLVPTLIMVGIVLYTDRKSKEPPKNIIICLLSGILTVALAGYLEQRIMPFFVSSWVLTYVWATIEEMCKLSIFFLFIFDNKHYDDIYDGVVYMSLIALSFAGLENIMYAFSESTVNNGISLALMRDFTTIPLHVICGIVMGYFVSLGNFSKSQLRKYINIVLGILLASFMHGTFNTMMNVLGNISVDYNNRVQILFAQVLPLIFIMIVLILVELRISNKAVRLNKIYVANEKYDDKYKYLMTYNEFYESSDRKRRADIHDKISLKKHDKKPKNEQKAKVKTEKEVAKENVINLQNETEVENKLDELFNKSLFRSSKDYKEDKDA